jgi:hypothetical protein
VPRPWRWSPSGSSPRLGSGQARLGVSSGSSEEGGRASRMTAGTKVKGTGRTILRPVEENGSAAPRTLRNSRRDAAPSSFCARREARRCVTCYPRLRLPSQARTRVEGCSTRRHGLLAGANRRCVWSSVRDRDASRWLSVGLLGSYLRMPLARPGASSRIVALTAAVNSKWGAKDGHPRRRAA